MPKQGKTPKKKSKEKTPQKSGCSILKKLPVGVEDSRIEEAKDMVARKIECELNDRAINPPRDTSRYQKEVGTFIWRLETFAKNFAELRQFGAGARARDHDRHGNDPSIGFEGRGEQEVPGITPHLQGNYQKSLWQCLNKLIITLAVWLARPTDDHFIDLRQSS